MAAKSVHLWLASGLLLALSCSDAPEGTAKDGRVPTGDDTGPVTDDVLAELAAGRIGSYSGFLPDIWALPFPLIDGTELIRGQDARIEVSNAPAYAEVTILRTNSVMGSGPCDEVGVCLDIVSPEIYAEGTADDTGRLEVISPIPATADPDVWYFQAYVYDPKTQGSAVTNVILRHVAVDSASAATEFVVDTTSGISGVFTDCNSHTGGAAWVDYNHDYFPDLLVANGGGLPHYLFRNNGDGTFADMSHLVPKPDPMIESAGVKFADIDNDGDTDIFMPVDSALPMVADPPIPQVHEGGPNLLYLNNGDGTFDPMSPDDMADAKGLIDPRGWRNIAAAFSDFDRDGWIDIWLGNWATASEPLGTHDNFDRVLRNNADGTGQFTDVTPTHGGDGLGRDVLTAIWFDADMDGYPDLYVGNVAHDDDPPVYEPRDVFYRNLGGTAFSDVTAQSPGISDDAHAAMGTDIGDVDNDGDWDLYITDRWENVGDYPKGNPLYLGSPDGQLSENSCADSGICTGELCWPANFADFNRDGWADLWVGSGPASSPDFLYMNTGDGTFDMHYVEDFNGNYARGGSIADYDADGDMDIFVWNQGANSRLYRHESRDSNNFMQFRLFGTKSNRDAIGAIIRVEVDGNIQMRRVSGGDSAHSQMELITHFGVGEATEAYVSITWPADYDDNVDYLGLVPVNQVVFVDEDAGVLSEEITSSSATWTAATQQLSVTAKSSFGGRTGLSVDGFPGSLSYRVDNIEFTNTWSSVSSNPGTVTLRSERGGEWTLPVVEL